jgi:hypothetical protein
MNASIYKIINPMKCWTIKSAEKFIGYFYNNFRELFFVIEHNRELFGVVLGQVKP